MSVYQEAINELLEMSAGIEQAVMVRGASEVLAGTYGGGPAEAAAVEKARAVLEEARAAAREMERPPLTQLFVETRSGCLFIVAGDRDTWLAVTTGPDPTVGLILYDANTALRTALEKEAAAGDGESDTGEAADGQDGAAESATAEDADTPDADSGEEEEEDG